MEAIHRARSFGGDATVLADYALTTTTTIVIVEHLIGCFILPSEQGHCCWIRVTSAGGNLSEANIPGNAYVTQTECPVSPVLLHTHRACRIIRMQFRLT